MKILLSALCAFLCVLLALPVSAEESEADIAENFSSAAGTAAEASGSELADALASDSIEETGKKLLELITPAEVLSEISDVLLGALPDAVKLFCVSAGLVMLSSVFGSLCGSLGDGGVSDGFSFLSAAAIASAATVTLKPQITRTVEFFDGLGALMNGMIPITGTVWAMGGNVTTAGAGTVTLYAMSAAVENICSAAVMPVCCIMGVCAVCACLSDGSALEGLANGVKRVYGFTVGLLMTVFVFTLGVQTSVAGAADTVTARGAKLLSSTVIPGVGGAVGDTLRTVAGSVTYIKNVVGIGGIVLVAVLTLPALASLLLSRLALLLCSALADMLGCKRESRLFSELGGIYGFLVGAVAVCSAAFVIALGIFVKCTVAAE